MIRVEISTLLACKHLADPYRNISVFLQASAAFWGFGSAQGAEYSPKP